MIQKYLKLKLLLLLIVSIFTVSCSAPIQKNKDQYSNESYQDSLNNFQELKFLFENKKYEQAYRLLDDMKSKLPYSRYTKHGKILEIHSYFEQSKFETTMQKADQFSSNHPLHPQVDYVLYLKAISSFNINKPLYQNLSQIPKIIEINRTKVRRTFVYFSDLAQKYPKSNYFKDTIKKVKYLRQVLADYELNDAYLLFEAAQYEKVIKHVDYLLKSYPRSNFISKALKLQAKAYRLVGQVDTAKSIETNIRRNYQK